MIQNYRAGAGLGAVNYAQVREDIRVVMTDSKEFWPADYGTYAGLFLRLAWHNAGSYRGVTILYLKMGSKIPFKF